MERRIVTALLLSFLMAMSGCIGNNTSVGSNTDSKIQNDVTFANLSISEQLPLVKVDEILVIEGFAEVTPSNTEFSFEYDFQTPSGLRTIDSAITMTESGFKIILAPDEPGTWRINVMMIIEGYEENPTISSEFSVLKPDEGNTILSTDPIVSLDRPGNLIISGSVHHENLDTCSVNVNSIQIKPSINGNFDYEFGFVDEPTNISLTATCGIWTDSYDSKLVRVIFPLGDDLDGDGISDEADSCPYGHGSEEGWKSNIATDRDSDGCHDFEEDIDDDNDMIPDIDDDCVSTLGWISNNLTDYDSDGCADYDEDEDDDNDGVIDNLDLCSKGEIGWDSKPYTDWDSDGCNDLTEDDDDDNDMVNDNIDSCWRGLSNWVSNSEFDYDGDGCHDQSEDEDDDNDGVYDLNETGIILDQCPRSPLDAQDVDETGCDATERDTDADGVVDAEDQCPGTPQGNSVNNVGCADLDGDGVFSNVDNCSNTEPKWTIDSEGCAVYQHPVAWKETGHGSNRMDTVAHFSLPTLDGTWSFRNEWNGNDVYIFLFKYTDTSGNSNNADWSKNPGSMIRQLPDNAHLFYGSFDNSYKNDVLSRKTAVENALNPNEELKWQGRIHYIDQDMSTASGGLGDVISNWNSFYYGIDRFQRAREIGSIYAWTSQTNDITHWAYEARMYNYEFKTEIRDSDVNIHSVTIVDEEWHSGGWGGGYTSTYENVTISLPTNISSYDTLEVFHEHACEDRRDRYSNSNGNYGGCHEWDYLAYMKICDRDNNTKCGTEFMRWITTYGREGRWLTDISPYLFMLQDNDTRNFRYQGANKGMLTVKLYFSNWEKGERPVDAEQMFYGNGQFNGQYNNESLYKRQHNFTAPSSYYSAKIVATITGHGFNQDRANCAEFCDHEHHYYLNGYHTYEWHPIVSDNQGCEKEVDRGVVANQYGSWPFGRAGWCAGQDVKQWVYDITDWVDNNTTNNLIYRGLYNGQEYVPEDTNGGSRKIEANVWLVWYNQN